MAKEWSSTNRSIPVSCHCAAVSLRKTLNPNLLLMGKVRTGLLNRETLYVCEQLVFVNVN